MNKAQELSIGEVACRAGLRTSALRYYEQAGLIPPPRRVNGRRRYDSNVLRLLGVIRCAQEAGFTLEEIATLLHAPTSEQALSARWERLARTKLQELDALAARIATMKQLLEASLDSGCVQLEDCPLPDRRSARTSRNSGSGVVRSPSFRSIR